MWHFSDHEPKFISIDYTNWLFKKEQDYLHLTPIREFGVTKVLADRVGAQTYLIGWKYLAIKEANKSLYC